MPAPAQAEAELLGQVTVVTVTYNSAHCLPALGEGLRGVPHVVVVDNGSGDGSPEAAARHLPQARRIALGRNLGYGAANNAGIAEARTPYVLLLNPDCLVTAAQVAALVAGAHEWPDAAMWVPQIVGGDGRPDVNYSWPRHAWTPRTGGADGPLCVGYACAAALLIDRARMAPLGFFDTRFFLYYEDEDLCLRAFEARAPIVVLPQVRIGHLSRGSVRGRRPHAAEYWRGWHHAQSKIRFAAKHFGPAAGERLLDRTLARAWMQVAARLLLPSPRMLARAWGRLQGLRALRRGRGGLAGPDAGAPRA
ncbi:MAG: glycosyltransferase family 2 protein [Xylophilus ampelinus]